MCRFVIEPNAITVKNRLLSFMYDKKKKEEKHDGCSIVCFLSPFFFSTSFVLILLFSIHKSDTRAKKDFNSNSTPSKEKNKIEIVFVLKRTIDISWMKEVAQARKRRFNTLPLHESSYDIFKLGNVSNEMSRMMPMSWLYN